MKPSAPDPVSTLARAPRAERVFRCAFGLCLTPCAVGAAALFMPELHVTPGLANALAFAGATLLPILALAIAATADVTLLAALAVAALSVALLLALVFLRHAPVAAMLVVDSALVGFAWSVGTSIGRRVQHASHLLPACVVAASADLVSLLSPEGPSHAVAQSDRALSVLAVWFPVPGTLALAPALGVGDLLFMALVFGVAVVHHLPYVRTVSLAAFGTAVAGGIAARLGVAVPALVPISAAILLGLPQVRHVRPADRKAATWAMSLAGMVVVAVVARRFLSR
ncbi:MAG TPA: hypothetical protein VK745_18180 [Polyangiaceae bacterium]|jgi:hypothetical protein|nr:hypothetical protein [Polyangiaceae bacterium]